jgi:hypothetical protein
LTSGLPGDHNVQVRARDILMAIALAVLALAGLRLEAAAAIAPGAGTATPSQLAAPPAPDVDPPAIVRAAITSSTHVPSQLSCDTSTAWHPVTDVRTNVRQTSLEPDYDVSRPRTFPLLN